MVVKNRSERLPVPEQIRKGLEEAIRWARGELTLRTTVLVLPDPPPAVSAADVTALRARSEMSQTVFAQLLNVSTKTVQSWEQGTRKPSHAALRLIQVLSQSPHEVFQAAGVPLPQVQDNGAKRRAPVKAAKKDAPTLAKARKQTT
jgi:putative transcriptional regulator